jgi:hypothetical protein
VAPKKISAKELVADINAGMSDDELKRKYGISDEGLERLFQQLLDKGLVKESDLSRSTCKPPVEKDVALSAEGTEAQRTTHSSPPSKTDTFVPTGDTCGEKNPQGFMPKFKNIVGSLSVALSSSLGLLGSLFKKRSSDAKLPSQPEPEPKPTASGLLKDTVQVGKGSEDHERGSVSQPTSTLGFLGKIKAIPSALAGFLVSLLTGKVFFKILVYLVSLILFVASMSVIIDPDELKLLKEVQSLQRVDPVPRTKELEAAGELCQALDYLGHFMEYDYVQNNPEISALYGTLKKKRESWLFRATEGGKGIIYGKGVCPEATLTATVSDFLLIGDVRDLTWGLANKYYYKENTDDFTTALAGVGVLLWGATVVSIPTAPIHGGSGTAGTVACKASVVFLKLGNKMGKLSKPLKASLTNVLKETKKTGKLKHLEPIAESVYTLSKTPGVRVKDAMTILSRCTHVNDLEHMAKATSVYGKKTAKFLELGGERSLEIFKKFGHSKNITTALDSAIMHGPKGLSILERVGPDKFIKYLTISKFSVRGVRSWHEGRLTELAKMLTSYGHYLITWLMSLLPQWGIFSIAAVSGLVVIGIPAKSLYAGWRWFRGSA